ncbi:MAG: hypothetical protein M3134_10765 [Actinomycetota bacterium]|nr:hypothetical protein [Actinomycetota bacterium]
MRCRICLLVLVGVFVSHGAAHADTRGWRDGNDARGPLDIVRIEHAHRASPDGVRQLLHTVRLDRGWPVDRLRHRGFVHLIFELPGHPDNPPERAVWIVYRKGKLVATMYNTLGDPPRKLARVALLRPNRRTLKVAFPKSLLRKGDVRRYRWNVVSFVEGRHELCPRRSGCTDWAPNPQDDHRYVKHVL